VRQFQILGAAELTAPFAKQDDDVARPLNTAADDTIGVLEQTDHANDRCRIDRAAIRLVVETHVPAGDRHAERTTGGANPFARPASRDGGSASRSSCCASAR